jgi:hypothetical protein
MSVLIVAPCGGKQFIGTTKVEMAGKSNIVQAKEVL